MAKLEADREALTATGGRLEHGRLTRSEISYALQRGRLYKATLALDI
jgi:hypothetical protein